MSELEIDLKRLASLDGKTVVITGKSTCKLDTLTVP